MNYIGIIGIYILVLAVIFVPTILNNKKRKKKFNDMISSLKENDKVVTIGGICASVIRVNENTVDVRIDKGVSLTILKEAISRVEK